MTLTNAQLIRLFQGLSALDGLRTKPNEIQPYDFDPDTEWKIANNISLLQTKATEYQRAQKALAMRYGIAEGQEITPENASKVAEFIEAMHGLEDKQVEVTGLEMIPKDKLKLGHKKDQNPIPRTVLAAIMPVLE